MNIWRACKMWVAGALGGLVVVSALALAAMAMADSREIALKDAEIAAVKLALIAEQSMARTFETYALSMDGAVKAIESGAIRDLPVEVQRLAIFDTAAQASGFGSILVLDAQGSIQFDSRSEQPRLGDFSDRDYFKAQIAADAGLYISAPFVSRLDQAWSVAMSRRVNAPDGGFAGVVTGTVKLAGLRQLFDRLASGNGDSTISLFRTDGVALVRSPHLESEIGKSFAHVLMFKHFKQADHGTFDQVALRDGVARRYVYGRVGSLPLVFSIGLSSEDVLRNWRQKAELMGGLGFAILAIMVTLAIMLWRELARRRTAEQIASAAASRFEQLASNSTDAIVLRNLLGVRIYASPRFYELLGRSADVVGDKRLVDFLHHDSRPVPSITLRKLLSGSETTVSEMLQCLRPDGSSIWLEAVSRLLPRADGETSEILTSIRDVTVHKTRLDRVEVRKAELETLANLDGLTGIANRRAFDDAYRREIARAKVSMKPLSVLMMDVDRFKRFNDRLGHAAGDEALKTVALCIASVTLGSPGVAARYGGEEFVLLLPGVDLAGARHMGEQLRSALAEAAVAHPDGGLLTISIGVATCAPARCELDLIASADKALYAAKAAGRNRVEVFGPQATSLREQIA